MSKNHPHDNIYNILGKLASLTPKEEPKQESLVKELHESIEAKGSVLEGVSAVEARLKKQFSESAHVCAECGMVESECGCSHVEEGEVEKTKHGIKHTKTDYPGYASDDDEESEEERSKEGKKGRPRKATTKKPRPTGDRKGMKGRPKKDDSEKTVRDSDPFSSKNKMGHDPFGRVKAKSHDKAETGSGKKIKGTATSDKAPKGSPEYVDEKAVSVAQQKFMGMVHSAQKGAKPASPEVAKVARTMGKKDARDFAATKHKGLPQHIAESINFKRMMDETSLTLDEMLNSLNKDMNEYKLSGKMSENLRDFLHIHQHAKKQMEEQLGNLPPSQVPGKEALLKTPATPAQGMLGKVKDTLGGVKDFFTGKPENPNRPTYEEDLALEEELNELARLAGLETEGNAFTGKLKSTPKGDKFALGGKTFKDTSSLEEEPNEGNAFTGKLKDTPKGGKFDLDGETYTDTSGLDEADVDVQEPVKAVNVPNEKYTTVDQIISQGDDMHRQKKQFAGKPRLGDNPMASESALKLEARLAAEYESIKKVK